MLRVNMYVNPNLLKADGDWEAESEAMKKAAIVTFIGFLIIIVMKLYGIYAMLDTFRTFEELEISYPISQDLYIASLVLWTVPAVCYAAFFCFVLQNELKPAYGIIGAGAALLAFVFDQVIWAGQRSYDDTFSLLYMLIDLVGAIFMLQYFVNLTARKISMKASIWLACAAFAIYASSSVISMYQNYAANIEWHTLAEVLQMNMFSLINLIAWILASAFFFAMAKNITKNG